MRTILGWAAVMVIVGAARTDAAFTVTFRQSGNDVVATGSGTLATSMLTSIGPGSAGTPSLVPSAALVLIGAGTPANVPTSIFLAFFTPASGFGPGSFAPLGTSGTGANVGMEPSALFLFVPVDYASGSQLSSTTTFANATLTSLGLGLGSFAYSYAATQGGAVVDTFTVQIDFADAAVPEPASLAMVGTGLLGLGVAARKRRP